MVVFYPGPGGVHVTYPVYSYVQPVVASPAVVVQPVTTVMPVTTVTPVTAITPVVQAQAVYPVASVVAPAYHIGIYNQPPK
ncbi:hypothetical protein RB595_001765 [Gaeumannomyces hyphopodioides]